MTLNAENKNIVEAIQASASDSVRDYNVVFRQAANNLIIGAGILLALSTQLVGQIKEAPLSIRALSVFIVTLLCLSIAFGIVQQLMEAAFFRRIAVKKRGLIDKVSTTSLKSPDRILGQSEAISAANGSAVKRWPLAVQLTMLGMALLLIIAISILYLFQ